jgi:hypothetical protein
VEEVVVVVAAHAAVPWVLSIWVNVSRDPAHERVTFPPTGTATAVVAADTVAPLRVRFFAVHATVPWVASLWVKVSRLPAHERVVFPAGGTALVVVAAADTAATPKVVNPAATAMADKHVRSFIGWDLQGGRRINGGR